MQGMDHPGFVYRPFNEKAEGTDSFVGHQATVGQMGGGSELLRLQQQLQHIREVALHKGTVVLIIPVLGGHKNTQEGGEFSQIRQAPRTLYNTSMLTLILKGRKQIKRGALPCTCFCCSALPTQRMQTPAPHKNPTFYSNSKY